MRLEIAKRLQATYNVTNVVFDKRKESQRFNSIHTTSESNFRFQLASDLNSEHTNSFGETLDLRYEGTIGLT